MVFGQGSHTLPLFPKKDQFKKCKPVPIHLKIWLNVKNILFYFIYFIYFYYFIVVQLQLSAFCPHHSHPPQPNPPPSFVSTLPLGFVYVSFIVVPEIPSPHCPSPLVIIRLFLISMSLVIFCLLFSFADYVPVKGEIIWYLSLTTLLISLSIMLSSSIHAVPKV